MRGGVSASVLAGLALDGPRGVVELGSDIFPSGGKATAQILVGGIVGEVRKFEDGRRQILALRVPGDALIPNDGDPLVALTRVRTSGAAAVTASLSDASADYQPLRRAWVAAGRMDLAMLRDQVVRLGRMSARERLAHFLLEHHERLAQVGLANEASAHLPLTQDMIGDIVGLSVVHLNRTLQGLRRDEVVTLRHGYVSLHDRAQLVEIAGYRSRYPTPWTPSALSVRRGAERAHAVVA